MTEAPPPIRRLASYVQVSRQLAEDMGLLPDSRTPAEIAAAAQRSAQLRAAEAREYADRLARHRVLAGLDSTLGRVAVMHGPQYDNTGYAECHGCEIDGPDAEPPRWPCQTWVLIDTETKR